MTEFNELQSTNDFLVGELLLARQTNDLMAENNRRLEKLLIKCIKDLQECNQYLDEMRLQVSQLANLALDRVKMGLK
jgi:hypothetical protein